MAVTVYPGVPDYNNGQATSPGTYQDMTEWWGGEGCLTVPFGPDLGVTVLAGGWESRPGRALIRGGHIFDSDTAESGQFSPNPDPSPRYDWVVVRTHFQNFSDPGLPNGEVTVVEGAPGGGNPAVSRDPLGDWDVPLLLAEITSDGAANFAGDARVFVMPGGELFGLFIDSVIEPRPEQRFYHWGQRQWYRWFEPDGQAGQWVTEGPDSVLIERYVFDTTRNGHIFADIPQHYSHLMIEMEARNDDPSFDFHDVLMRFNDDAGVGSYATFRNMFLADGSQSRLHQDNASDMNVARVGHARRSVGRIHIPAYSRSQEKGAYGEGSAVNGAAAGAMGVYQCSGVWLDSSAPITKVHLFMTGSNFNFVAGSSLSLYGLR